MKLPPAWLCHRASHASLIAQEQIARSSVSTATRQKVKPSDGILPVGCRCFVVLYDDVKTSCIKRRFQAISAVSDITASQPGRAREHPAKVGWPTRLRRNIRCNTIWRHRLCQRHRLPSRCVKLMTGSKTCHCGQASCLSHFQLGQTSRS